MTWAELDEACKLFLAEFPWVADIVRITGYCEEVTLLFKGYLKTRGHPARLMKLRGYTGPEPYGLTLHPDCLADGDPSLQWEVAKHFVLWVPLTDTEEGYVLVDWTARQFREAHPLPLAGTLELVAADWTHAWFHDGPRRRVKGLPLCEGRPKRAA